MKENKGLELAEKLTDYVNTFSMSEKTKDFIEGFNRQHRTLQQSSFRLILSLIENIASDDFRVDGRNEASKKVAKMLLSGFQAEYHKELIATGISEEAAKKYIGPDFKPSKHLPFI